MLGNHNGATASRYLIYHRETLSLELCGGHFVHESVLVDMTRIVRPLWRVRSKSTHWCVAPDHPVLIQDPIQPATTSGCSSRVKCAASSIITSCDRGISFASA